MSHAATNWAIAQRGLKPATKIVLWHLCDRHNPDRGCFPSQERLAHDCEMARSTVRAHLDLLEKLGLIKRANSIDPQTKRQNPTEYLFPFDPGFADALTGETDVEDAESRGRNSATEAVAENEQKPWPKNGKSRGRKSARNPVREPLRKPSAENGGGAPDGPPPFSGGGDPASPSEDPKIAGIRHRARIKVLTEWLCSGDVEPADALLAGEKIRFSLSGEEASAFICARIPYAEQAKILSWADWAAGLAAGQPLDPPPAKLKPQIDPLSEALRRQGEMADFALSQGREPYRAVDRRIETLRASVMAERARRRDAGEGIDTGADDQQAEESSTERSEASLTGRPQRNRAEGEGSREDLSATTEDAA